MSVAHSNPICHQLMLMYNQVMLAFSYIYYVECVLKLSALGLDGYFGDGWCRFDFFLVCMSLLDQFATDFLARYLPLPPMLLRVMRIFRILRILRLLRHAKSLRDLLVTMILSFPSLLNVGSLLALIIFVYAVLGQQLFTFLVRINEGGINEVRNFISFGSSFLLLFQCLTGDGWSSFMADAMVDEGSGECSMAAGDCGSIAAVPYFISFQIVGCFVFVNLIVAVILENFASLHNMDPELVATSDLEAFSEAWSEFDPDATNFIPLEHMPALLLRVPRPLGLKGRSEQRAKQLCMRLRLVPDEDHRVAFREVLVELIDNNYFRSSNALDEEQFKGLVPALEPKRASSRTNGAGEYFSMAIFEQEHVKNSLLGMMRRAQDRLARRSPPLSRASKAAAKKKCNGASKSSGPPEPAAEPAAKGAGAGDSHAQLQLEKQKKQIALLEKQVAAEYKMPPRVVRAECPPPSLQTSSKPSGSCDPGEGVDSPPPPPMPVGPGCAAAMREKQSPPLRAPRAMAACPTPEAGVSNGGGSTDRAMSNTNGCMSTTSTIEGATDRSYRKSSPYSSPVPATWGSTSRGVRPAHGGCSTVTGKREKQSPPLKPPRALAAYGIPEEGSATECAPEAAGCENGGDAASAPSSKASPEKRTSPSAVEQGRRTQTSPTAVGFSGATLSTAVGMPSVRPSRHDECQLTPPSISPTRNAWQYDGLPLPLTKGRPKSSTSGPAFKNSLHLGAGAYKA